MKQICNSDFDMCRVYSGIRDIFGNSCLLIVNDNLEEIRIVSKNADYRRKRKKLDDTGCSKVYTSRYSEVINISKKQ